MMPAFKIRRDVHVMPINNKDANHVLGIWNLSLLNKVLQEFFMKYYKLKSLIGIGIREVPTRMNGSIGVKKSHVEAINDRLFKWSITSMKIYWWK